MVSAFTLAIYGFVGGAIVGAILGALFNAMSAGRRDFSSVTGVQAPRYIVNVDDEMALAATRLLEEMGRPTSTAH
jgi:hypothetical protein